MNATPEVMAELTKLRLLLTRQDESLNAYEGVIASKLALIAALEKHIDAIGAENTRLRAALAQSELPCIHCSLSREDWGKCEIGFPGCARADDATGCPELGAALERDQLRRDNDRLRTVLYQIAGGAYSEGGAQFMAAEAARWGAGPAVLTMPGDDLLDPTEEADDA